MRHRHVLILRASLLLVASLLLSSCIGGPPPRLYLLEPVVPLGDAIQVTGAQLTISAVGMSPITLPGYVRDAGIASLSDSGTVVVDGGNRWAEEPSAAISRVLAERMRALSGATVLIEPWPRDFAPSARVEVAFDRLLREPLGGADMSGQILLLSGDGRSLLRVLPFQFVHYGASTDRRVFFSAVSRGINDIARMTVRALQELNQKS